MKRRYIISLANLNSPKLCATTPAPDVAIIAYTVKQKVTINGKSQDLRAADSSTWIRGAEGWECHAHSEDFLKE